MKRIRKTIGETIHRAINSAKAWRSRINFNLKGIRIPTVLFKKNEIPPAEKNETPGTSPIHLCVIVSMDYLIKFLAFYRSVAEQSRKPFRLWVCCIDSEAYHALRHLKLEHAEVFLSEEIEDLRIRKVQAERKTNEYCWTLKSFLIEHLLVRYKLGAVLYCDADIYFFSDPAAIYDDWGPYSVYLCPQRDRPSIEASYGKYQAGMIGFRNDRSGLAALRWWKERCLEWCKAETLPGRFGDQKYLDLIPPSFSGVKISNHLGINAAPWNCIYNNDYPISRAEPGVMISSFPLVAYHFACITIFDDVTFDLWSLDKLRIGKAIMNEIYTPYLNQLIKEIQRLRSLDTSILERAMSQKPVSQAKTLYHVSPLQKEMDQWDDFYTLCTIVSEQYLPKGLALYYSLRDRVPNFHLWICCVDQASYRTLSMMKLAHATIIWDKQFSTRELKAVRKSRKLHEYCWTLKSHLCLFLLRQHLEIERILYCDADLYFFADPKPLFDEWAQYSVLMCRQRGSIDIELKHGSYQAGMIGFGRDENAQSILRWWADRCLEWCFDRFDPFDYRWGDQKYLDLIPMQFFNIKIVEHIGINAAPWNLVMNNRPNVSRRGEHVYLGGSPLIAYHFGSLEIINKNTFDLWNREPLSFEPSTIQYIYVPYIQELKRMLKQLKSFGKKPQTFLSGTPKKAMNPLKVS